MNIFPESEQLGIVIDSSLQDDMERFGASQQIDLEDAWPNTDKFQLAIQNSGSFGRKQVLTVKENE